MNNNPKKHSSSILGALACLVLFLILLGLKYSPNAPFPNMPTAILALPIWMPVLLLFLFVILYCFISLHETTFKTDEKGEKISDEFFDNNPFNLRP